MRRRIKKYSTAICVFLVLIVAAVSVIGSSKAGGRLRAVSADITNWGLSFQSEGQPPTGNASAQYLQKYDAIYHFPQENDKIYLTFDAGYENGNMPEILKALKNHKVKATFFLVGNFFESEPELVKQMVEEGHTIANHTYTHPDMSEISKKENFATELEKNEKLYKEITGKEMPRLYRPPQGKYSEQNLQMAQELGYKTVFWSLAYVDWYQDQQPSKEEAFSKLIPRIHPGAVVLLHSTSSTNAQILDELLTKWEELGYTFGDLETDLSAALK